MQWINNVNKGKATVLITGNGKEVNGATFIGSKTATVTITAGKDIKNIFDENKARFLNNLFNILEPAPGF